MDAELHPGFFDRAKNFGTTHRRFAVAAFVFITLLIFTNVGIFKHIGDKPNSVHTWAQSDRASVAACYYNESMNFFHPRIYNRSDGTNTGICGMEFPVINYSAAICYKIFGFHEFYYRLFNFMLLFIGLVCAFLMADLFLKDLFFSSITVWLFMMSPVLFFYSANFLPDTGSLGLVFISWYLFFKRGEGKSMRSHVLFIIMITLACLIKMTSMVSLITMIALMLGKRTRLFNSTNIPSLDRKMMTGLIICFACVFGWYKYAGWLNDHYHNYFFILKGNAVESMLEFKQVLLHIYEKPYLDYYPLMMKQVIAVCFGVFIVTFYFQKRLLGFTFLILLIGFAGFVVTMLRQFQYHDYYIIPLLPLIYFLFLTTAEFISRKINRYKILYAVAIAALLVLVNMSMIACKKSYATERYGKGYNASTYSEYERYSQASPYLDSLHVGKNDLVISYYDLTPNASLYLMNRKGTTVPYGEIGRLKELIATNNFKYLILNDTAAFTKELYESLVDKKIGEKYRVQVYQLKK
ncbi:hypothetical protein BH11BAC1_BH11BAC1_12430 [soil metagenome]